MKPERDWELRFPHVVILRASAGSGKTDALTKRYVQFLLSDRIPSSGLKNLLAVTFSNNAANEMRARILWTLKKLYFEDRERLKEFKELLSLSEKEISHRAGQMIQEILENYSDFQVRTIDSFMAKVFKAEAFNFDYPPDIEFSFSEAEIVSYAFNTYLDGLISSQKGLSFIEKLLGLLEAQKKTYMWDPKREMLKKVENLLTLFAQTSSSLASVEDSRSPSECEKRLCELAKEILHVVKEGCLKFNASSRVDRKFDEILMSGDFLRFLDFRGKKLPINQPKTKDLKAQEFYERAFRLWQEFQNLLSEYAFLHACSFFRPYIEVFKDFKDILESVKKRDGRVFVEDINRKISENLNEEIVPDIYFKIGETIYHFFIDEFQDTSPIQWFNLRPLIENSLSTGGSLFVVGDTKQAIYGFRGADYTVMKNLERENPFHPARGNEKVEKLTANWRSKGRIIEFVCDLFQKNSVLLTNYGDSLRLTGLSDVEQETKRGKEGYVEVERVPSGEWDLIKEHITSRIYDLRKRGYSFGDMAVLASTNKEITGIASILNEVGVPLISFSSLDVRNRKIVSEVLSLLSFLDSPADDFSFSCFIMSDLLKTFLAEKKISFDPVQIFLERRNMIGDEPLYKTFQKKYPDLWDAYFQKLFRLAGYLPVYDLLSVVYNEFDLLNLFSNEEAVLLRLLEISGRFEGGGYGNVKDFLDFFSSSDAERNLFDISLPRSADAVRLMTIHKAKGLGFPVLFVYLQDFDYRSKIPTEIGLDDGRVFTVMRVTKFLSECHEKLRRIREERKKSIIADFLNLLYVAFTRAEDELYVLCSVKNDSQFPFDFLRSMFGKKYGLKGRKEAYEPLYEDSFPITHRRSFCRFEIESPRLLNTEEKRRGDLIHRVLASVEYVSGMSSAELRRIVENRARHMGYTGDLDKITEDVLRIMKWDLLLSALEDRPGRTVKNEFEVSDPRGNLYRLDRLVVDPDEITIVEYKTGEPESEHIEQVAKYKTLVSSLFEGKKVKALIFYLEKMRVLTL